MSVTYIEDFLARKTLNRPRKICFFSPAYRDLDGIERSLNICVTVKDGDVAGTLSAVRENGGIGEKDDDGTFHFVPWPCAVLQIRDADSVEGENLEPIEHE